jgi:hypothetical protein
MPKEELLQRVTRSPAFVLDRHSSLPDTANITTQVVTMSSTLALRDRSLIGLAKPCRKGPMALAPPSHCVSL